VSGANPNPDRNLIAYLRSLKRLLSSREVSELLHIHQETLYRMVKKGFPCLRIDGRLKFQGNSIADYLERRSTS
jgi:predicted DNA-binding transcriptional regulator AlpA